MHVESIVSSVQKTFQLRLINVRTYLVRLLRHIFQYFDRWHWTLMLIAIINENKWSSKKCSYPAYVLVSHQWKMDWIVELLYLVDALLQWYISNWSLCVTIPLELIIHEICPIKVCIMEELEDERMIVQIGIRHLRKCRLDFLTRAIRKRFKRFKSNFFIFSI